MNWHSYLTKVQHHLTLIAMVVVGLVIVVLLGIIALRRRPRRLNIDYFQDRWHSLQKQCATKATWPLAIIDADQLLDEALKQRKFKGKTMGERLVSAQRSLTSNDMVWFGHKLRNKVVHENYKLNKRTEVKDALLGYLQALRDLGALHDDK